MSWIDLPTLPTEATSASAPPRMARACLFFGSLASALRASEKAPSRSPASMRAVAREAGVALDNDGGEFESRLVRYRRILR